MSFENFFLELIEWGKSNTFKSGLWGGWHIKVILNPFEFAASMNSLSLGLICSLTLSCCIHVHLLSFVHHFSLIAEMINVMSASLITLLIIDCTALNSTVPFFLLLVVLFFCFVFFYVPVWMVISRFSIKNTSSFTTKYWSCNSCYKYEFWYDIFYFVCFLIVHLH